MELVAKTINGLEGTLAEELKELGAEKIQILKRAVSFQGDKKLMYQANYLLRTAMRILMPIKVVQIKDEEELYNEIYKIDWSQYFSVKDTFAIDGVTASKFFTHSKYVALKSKDAIADQFRDKLGIRPNVNTFNPTLRINVRIFNTTCTISLDTSGDSLHKRGYRAQTLEAPLTEVLAAGMILLTKWKGGSTFIDPMCGSGTLLIEAGMIAKNIPAQKFRPGFGFQNWKDFDQRLFATVKKEAEDKIIPLTHPILGFDKDLRAVKYTLINLAEATLADVVEVKRKPFQRLIPPEGGGVLVMNPPYDERLKEMDIEAFYSEIGDQLKQHFAGFDAYIISSNIEALKKIGLRPSEKYIVNNGPLECKFQKFEMYQGSQKA